MSHPVQVAARNYLAEAERLLQGDTSIKPEFAHLRALYEDLQQTRCGYELTRAALLRVKQQLLEAQQVVA